MPSKAKNTKGRTNSGAFKPGVRSKSIGNNNAASSARGSSARSMPRAKKK